MADRNQYGQYATPPALARSIALETGKYLKSSERISFLEPAVGTGSFFSAVLDAFPANRISCAQGYEVDAGFAEAAEFLWGEFGLSVEEADFTGLKIPTDTKQRPNLLICNPPYSRHHHIATSRKKALQSMFRERLGIQLSGLAGLYCHFMLLGNEWLAPGGVAAWLVPTEFMQVNYGQTLRTHLADSVTIYRIHRFTPESVQFDDALVTSCVVWIRKEPPPASHRVNFTLGESLAEPASSLDVPQHELRTTRKWTDFFDASYSAVSPSSTTLGDFFDVRRGIATGSNRFFILDKDECTRLDLEADALRPILPGPRWLPDTRILADAKGNPQLDRRKFLLDVRLPPDMAQTEYPNAWAYLESGRVAGVSDGYLCRHRKFWYLQEDRAPSPILCTYMGRKRNNGSAFPFRFFLNESRATATNVFLLMYPKGLLAQAVEEEPVILEHIWRDLNELDADVLMKAGRIYGGGLQKMEPKELLAVDASFIEKRIVAALDDTGKHVSAISGKTRPLFP